MTVEQQADSAPYTALVDFPGPFDGPGQAPSSRQRLAFRQPLRWLVAWQAAQVPGLLDEAHALAKAGHWCVGFVAYEAAGAFDPSLATHAAETGTPLVAFAVHDRVDRWPDPPIQQNWRTADWISPLTPATFVDKVHRIHELIRQGEVYQINLTSPLRSQLEHGTDALPDGLAPTDVDTVLAYFHALHRSQPAGYGAWLDLRGMGGEPSHLLSVSPELFFDWRRGLITTRPMKGTAARGVSPVEDAQAARHLLTSAKERAENLMIVDLLRNDLSRVAQTGSVHVPVLFEVQALPTVWQMTSTVQAMTRLDVTLSDVFAALFPCGSVTGAPKRRAMHHIALLEAQPRGIYCGAVGLMAPGGDVTFNVPIRTVVLNGRTPDGWRARCGIGSGITLDAQAGDEALEWHHKQAFLRRAAEPFDLLESMRLEDGVVARLALHAARLARSAAHFGYPFDPGRVEEALLQAAARHPQGVFKLRLRLTATGEALCEATPLSATVQPIRVAWGRTAMPEADDWVRHKTTRRAVYAPFAPPADCFDTLLHNRAGDITEFTIGNVAVLLDGQWVTPLASAGLLPGVMRESLLAQGRLIEQTINLADLHRAQGMALINSVRGWLEVDWRHLGAQLPLLA